MQSREKLIERNLWSTQTTHLGFQSQIYFLAKLQEATSNGRKPTSRRKSLWAMETKEINEFACNMGKIQSM